MRLSWFIPVLSLSVAGTLVYGIFRRPEGRSRGEALLACLLAIFCVNAAVGYGRGDLRGIPAWYAALEVPFAWIAYLVFSESQVRPIRFIACGTIALLGILSMPRAARDGWHMGNLVRNEDESMYHDAQIGVSIEEFAGAYHFTWWPATSIRRRPFHFMYLRRLGLFDENEKWLLQPPSHPAHETHQGRYLPGPEGPDSGSADRIRTINRSVILKVQGKEDFFSLSSLLSKGRKGGIVRFALFSPHETLARFKTRPNEVDETEIHRGLNFIAFTLPGPQSDFVPQLSPGVLPGNYRIRSYTIYPPPIALSPPPPVGTPN